MPLKRQPFKKLASLLKGIAPTAVSALAGPYAPLALNLMKRVLGDEAMSDEELEAAVVAASASPTDFVKLKEIEAAMESQEAQMEIRFAELEVEDRQGARNLAIQTNFWPQVVLSVIFVVGYFVVLALFFTGDETLTVPMSDAFMVMLGVLTAGVPTILSFWLGSTSSSKEKNETIARLSERQ